MSDQQQDQPINLATKRLEVAQPPAKERILAMLDMLRAEAERGEVVSMVALTIRTGEVFDVTMTGEVGMATLAGFLARAHLDVLETMGGKR